MSNITELRVTIETLKALNKGLKADLEAAKKAVAASRPYVLLYFARNPTAGELTPGNEEDADMIITIIAKKQRE